MVVSITSSKFYFDKRCFHAYKAIHYIIHDTSLHGGSEGEGFFAQTFDESRQAFFPNERADK
ncbi:MAG: hypothetical protein ACI8RD_014138 [Bacillariaceae sp.]|jgi:hypothetical protein